MDFTVIRKYAVRFVSGSRAPLAVSAFLLLSDTERFPGFCEMRVHFTGPVFSWPETDCRA